VTPPPYAPSAWASRRNTTLIVRMAAFVRVCVRKMQRLDRPVEGRPARFSWCISSTTAPPLARAPDVVRPHSPPMKAVVVINLNRRRDRLASVRRQLSVTDLGGLPLLRLEAHDGGTTDVTTLLTPAALEELAALKRMSVRSHHAQLTPGAVGCYLSHVDVWRYVAAEAAKDGDDVTPTLILEDDVALPTGRVSLAGDIAQAWAAAQARNQGTGRPCVVGLQTMCWGGCDAGDTGVLSPTYFWGMVALLMNGKAAKQLLDRGNLFPIDVQIDAKLRYIRDAGIIAYLVVPVLGFTALGTDIQTGTIPDAPFDRGGNVAPAS